MHLQTQIYIPYPPDNQSKGFHAHDCSGSNFSWNDSWYCFLCPISPFSSTWASEIMLPMVLYLTLFAVLRCHQKEMHMHRTNPFNSAIAINMIHSVHNIFISVATILHHININQPTTSVQTIYRFCLMSRVNMLHVPCCCSLSQCRWYMEGWSRMLEEHAPFLMHLPPFLSLIHSHQAHFFVHFRERSEISSQCVVLEVGR